MDLVYAQLMPLNTNTNPTVYPGETFVIECGIKIGSVSQKEKGIKVKLMYNEFKPSLEDNPNNNNWLNPSFTLDYSSYKYDEFFCRVRSNGDLYAEGKTQYDGPHYHIKCECLKSLILIILPLH